MNTTVTIGEKILYRTSHRDTPNGQEIDIKVNEEFYSILPQEYKDLSFFYFEPFSNIVSILYKDGTVIYINCSEEIKQGKYVAIKLSLLDRDLTIRNYYNAITVTYYPMEITVNKDAIYSTEIIGLPVIDRAKAIKNCVDRFIKGE